MRSFNVTLPVKPTQSSYKFPAQLPVDCAKVVGFSVRTTGVSESNRAIETGNGYTTAFLTLYDKNGRLLLENLALIEIAKFSSPNNHLGYFPLAQKGRSSLVDFNRSAVVVKNTTGVTGSTDLEFVFYYEE